MALEIEPQEAAKTFENRIASSSSEDDEPVQLKRVSLKKRINLSDDDSDGNDASPKLATSEGNPSSPEKSEHSSEEGQKANIDDNVSSAKKHKRRVLVRSDSEESDNEERASSRQSQNEDTQATQQQRILENLRSDNGYDAESSDEELPKSGRYSSNSHHSGGDEEEMAWEKEKNKSKRPKAPPRKSATACRKAMQEERLKMISESQRMVRESKASLPYHKPRQRTLQEFLKARPQPSPLLKGTKHQQVALELIGQELEKCEKLAEEFYKAASEDEEENENERLTPPPKTPELPTIPGENRVLKVSLSTSDSQATQLTEHDESETTTNTQDQDTQMTTTDSQTNNTQMTSTDTQMTEMSQPEESKIPSETSSQHISSCPDTDPDLMPSIENKPKTTEEPRKIILETPDSEYDSSPVETDNAKKTVIPDTPDSDPVSSDPKESTILALDTPDDFQPPEKNMEVSGNVIGETPDSETVDKSSQLAKLILSTENTDVCLTAGDAEDNMFLKPAQKEKKTSDPLEEDSMDTDDFHLVLEDTDDIVADVPESPEVKIDKPLFDLEKLYNSGDLLGEDKETTKPELKGRAKILAAKLKLASGPVRLSGGPNELIDLDATPAVKEGVNDLVQRFMRQASAGVKKPAAKEGLLKLMQDGEAVEDAPDLKDKPGAKMSLLKSELRQSLAKLRDEEFKRRQREYQIYENEMEGIVGDDTESKVLSDEEMEILGDEKEEENGAASESGNTESEPELEDDIELKDAPLPRSEFMDDEAEESEHEEEVEDDVAKEEMEGLEEGPEESEEEEDPEESEGSDEEEIEEKVQETSTPAGEKRKFSRIKKLDDSDDEDKLADVPPEVKPPTAPVNNKTDTLPLENTLDTLPLENTPDLPLEDTPDTNEKDKSFASVCNQSFNLSLLEETSGSVEAKSVTNDSRFPTGITQLCADTQMKVETTNNVSPVKSLASAPKGLENLFQYSNSYPDDDIGGLCSGQFPPSNVPEGIEILVQNPGSYPDDLGGLCSGQFPETQPAKKIPSPLKGLFGGGETQTQDDLAMLCSGQFLTQDPSQVDKPKDLDKLISTSFLPTNVEDLCSGQFVTQADVTETAEKGEEISKTEDVIKTTDLDTDSSSTRKVLEMRIVSDDEDGEELDDEDDEAGGPEDAEESMAEESELEDVLDDEEGVIDYDSEENEV
ncbi:hypothetical protein B566_EDAN011832 [Ephemera danica]|nr:hypothetical protein B566_EDAN011832 [Ephemera danica]